MNPVAAPALDLRDIHAAAPPGIWPPAPGWWILAALLLAALLVSGIWLFRRYRRHRYKRQVMDELDALGSCYQSDNTAAFVTGLSTLMRRIALGRYARDRVASLTGTAWLQFLDETGGGGEFAGGIGRVLAEGAYRPHAGDLPVAELLALTRRWVAQNLEAAT